MKMMCMYITYYYILLADHRSFMSSGESISVHNFVGSRMQWA